MASWITDDKPSSGSAAGLVADAINDGTTTVAPSQNAVFDALAVKVPTSRTIAGLDLSADRTDAALRTALSLVVGTDVQAYDATAWRVISDQTLAVAASAISVSSLGTYTEFRLRLSGASSNTGGLRDTTYMQFNGVTDTSYQNAAFSWVNTAVVLGILATSQTNTNRSGYLEARWTKDSTARWMLGHGQFSWVDPDATVPASDATRLTSWYFTPGSVTSLRVYLSGSNFVAGTRFVLEGRI